MMKIWVNSITYNEENFIWFALMSVIDYVDHLLVWDTGSTDQTPIIVQDLIEKYPKKITFRQCGRVDKFKFTKLRQEMLDQTKSDWLLLLDGDEIWLDGSIQKLIKTIKEKPLLDGIVVPFYNLIGDVHHYQSQSAGQYKMLGRTGHLTIRAINLQIPGLHLEHPYGQEGYFDDTNRPIQDRKNLIFLNAPYFHATHLKRSAHSRGDQKYKYELGSTFSQAFKYPSVFTLPRPTNVADPLKDRSISYYSKAALLTPLKNLKRKLL